MIDGAESGRRYDRSCNDRINNSRDHRGRDHRCGGASRHAGQTNIGMIMTVVLGALGGLIGSAVASYFGYHNANGGVAWIPFFIGVGAAVILIAIHESLTGRRTRTRLPR